MSVYPMIVDVLEHVDKTNEILVRILLARGTHIVVIASCSSKKIIRHIRFLVALHGSIDIGKSLLTRSGCCVRPVFVCQTLQSAEHAVVSRRGASILTAKIQEEF
jgi:hypothetical protein